MQTLPRSPSAHANDQWEAWVDGTAVPNPGRLAIGGVLVSPAGERSHFSQALGGGCNNEAELHAIEVALVQAATAGARRIVIHSDSRFAVDCLNGLDDTDVPRFGELLTRTRAAIAGFDAVTVNWLPRHRNAESDRLARAALGLLPKPPAKPARKRR